MTANAVEPCNCGIHSATAKSASRLIYQASESAWKGKFIGNQVTAIRTVFLCMLACLRRFKAPTVEAHRAKVGHPFARMA